MTGVVIDDPFLLRYFRAQFCSSAAFRNAYVPSVERRIAQGRPVKHRSTWRDWFRDREGISLKEYRREARDGNYRELILLDQLRTLGWSQFLDEDLVDVATGRRYGQIGGGWQRLPDHRRRA